MRSARVTAFAVASSIALISSSAFASACWQPNEVKAAQIRSFQALVMVGALQCRYSNPLAVERYNEFVERHRGFLDANTRILKAHFAREAGNISVQDAYDQYATELSNIQSAQNSLDPDFCGRVDLLVRTATSSSQSDLLSLAQAVSDEPASGPCAATNYAAAEPAKPAAAALIVAEAAPQPAGAAPDASAAGNQAALNAAIAALQAATVALQTVASTPAGAAGDGKLAPAN